MDFLDGILTGTEGSFYMEAFLLDPASSPCVGQLLSPARLRAQSGALAAAIRRADGMLAGGSAAEEMLEAEELLFCMGTAEQLRTESHFRFESGGFAAHPERKITEPLTASSFNMFHDSFFAAIAIVGTVVLIGKEIRSLV